MNKNPKHPIQPLYKDEHDTLRFKENAIVRYLLNAGPFDMNDLADERFSIEDMVQFAQLIGYSLGGFGDLSYVSDDTYETARLMADEDKTEEQARIEHLQGLVDLLREKLAEPMAELFGKHIDDFKRE